MWMGLLSFIITSGKNITLEANQLQLKPIPHWFDVLQKAGFDKSWLAGIHSPIVCSFQWGTNQVGVFTHLTPKNKEQPQIAWCIAITTFLFGTNEVMQSDKTPLWLYTLPFPNSCKVEQLFLSMSLLPHITHLQCSSQPKRTCCLYGQKFLPSIMN
jgi:hypothetical protein